MLPLALFLTNSPNILDEKELGLICIVVTNMHTNVQDCSCENLLGVNQESQGREKL